MDRKTINFTDFRDNLRQAVIDALDETVRGVMETPRVDGWKDQDLPCLFSGVDLQAEVLAKRINAGDWVNSAYVSIDMDK